MLNYPGGSGVWSGVVVAMPILGYMGKTWKSGNTGYKEDVRGSQPSWLDQMVSV